MRTGPATIVVVSPAPLGRHGDPGGAPTERPIPGCWVYPRGGTAASSEDTTARDQVVRGRTVVAPPGTVVRPVDRVRLPESSDLWEVDGDVGPWESLNGAPRGVEFALTRTTG